MEEKPESFPVGNGTYSLSFAIISLARAVHELAHAQTEGRLSSRLTNLEEKVKTLMATQQEIAESLRTSVAQLTKVQGEIQGVQTATDVLKAKVKELEDIIANNPAAAAIPELVEAAAAVAAQAQVVDDGIPDLQPNAQPRR